MADVTDLRTELQALHHLDVPWAETRVALACQLLEAGEDTPGLRMLAGEQAPFHWSTMRALVDRVLRELGCTPFATTAAAALALARIRVRQALGGERPHVDVLREIEELCDAYDHPAGLTNLWLLSNALQDLESSAHQWYWPGMDASNAAHVVDDYLRAWLRDPATPRPTPTVNATAQPASPTVHPGKPRPARSIAPRSNVRRALPILGLGIGAAVLYGVLHDLITVHVCVEYFTIGHAPVFSASPIWLAIGWGVIATWWVGALLGAGLAFAALRGPRPARSPRSLLPPIAVLLLAMAVSAAVAGGAGFALANLGWIVLLEPLASRVPHARHAAFLADLWAHSASYLTAFVGGILLIRGVWQSRQRLPRSAPPEAHRITHDIRP